MSRLLLVFDVRMIPPHRSPSGAPSASACWLKRVTGFNRSATTLGTNVWHVPEPLDIADGECFFIQTALCVATAAPRISATTQQPLAAGLLQCLAALKFDLAEQCKPVDWKIARSVAKQAGSNMRKFLVEQVRGLLQDPVLEEKLFDLASSALSLVPRVEQTGNVAASRAARTEVMLTYLERMKSEHTHGDTFFLYVQSHLTRIAFTVVDIDCAVKVRVRERTKTGSAGEGIVETRAQGAV